LQRISDINLAVLKNEIDRKNVIEEMKRFIVLWWLLEVWRWWVEVRII
jgi:hypothetical protein